MEMLAARMRADLAETPSFLLGVQYVKVLSSVDHLNACDECRKKRGPEFHAIAVLHLGLIEQEIASRGQEITVVREGRPASHFATLDPSMN